jgi:hypothetical protein
MVGAMACGLALLILAALSWRFIPQALYVFPSILAGSPQITSLVADRLVAAAVLCAYASILIGVLHLAASGYRRRHPLRRVK